MRSGFERPVDGAIEEEERDLCVLLRGSEKSSGVLSTESSGRVFGPLPAQNCTNR